MQKINSVESLRDAILQLEIIQAGEGILLKEQFHETYESIKPISLIRSILKQSTESADLKDNLINTGVGITAGYLSKLLFQGFTRSPVKRLIGTAVMFGITNLVAKNPDVVKSIAHKAIHIFQSRSASKKQKTEE